MVSRAVLRAAPAILFAACGGGLHVVPPGPHPITLQEYIEVEFPPPPARIEEVHEALEGQDECAWMDGHHHWQGRWVWIPGKWVIPPDDCYYAPAVVEWSRDAKLYYTPPRWFRDGAESLPANRALCPIPRACAGTPSAGIREP